MSPDYDVIVIGSGFGGSVTALRLSEKGYRVGVLKQGARWHPEDYPPARCLCEKPCGSRNSATLAPWGSPS
jgi:choline dehydrogenase-like flavoprotein